MTRMGPGKALHTLAVKSINDLPDDGPIKNADLVLVDYDLEDMTGFEVVEKLLQHYPGVKVVMISSTNRPTQDLLFRSPNICGFASKWQSPTEFLDTVRTFV